jgi:hypothetical protein
MKYEAQGIEGQRFARIYEEDTLRCLLVYTGKSIDEGF